MLARVKQLEKLTFLDQLLQLSRVLVELPVVRRKNQDIRLIIEGEKLAVPAAGYECMNNVEYVHIFPEFKWFHLISMSTGLSEWGNKIWTERQNIRLDKFPVETA